MPDPRQTSDRIRAILRSDSVGLTAEVVAVAADYAEMCHEANLRLRRCADFLREGLTGEALAFADARPALIDFVAALELKEIGEWERACGTMGLARPERLTTQIVNDLTHAAVQHEPIRELLKKHRYLALARHSLTDRLAVVRQLISLDPASIIWKREAEELEQARLATLHDEVLAAIEARDVHRVDALQAELNAGNWLSPIPFDLQETLDKAANALHQAIAVAELTAIVPRVREAFGSRSYDQCAEVFAQWGRVVKRAKILVPPELRDEILPLAHWIDEEDERRSLERQFRAACLAVKVAVETHEPVEELKTLYREAARFELDIPEEISFAYCAGVQRAGQELLTEKKRQYALAAALVGAIVVALGALTFVMLNYGRH